MAISELKKLERHRKLSALSNVVLLNGSAAELSQEHLAKKIHERIDKEFPDATKKEREIIDEIKQENLRWGKRCIKQQRDGEYFIQIQENVREKDVHLFHKFRDKNLDLMELLVMGDALLRSGVRTVTAYLPYIPYQRQDKKDEGRVPISSKLFFNLLKASLSDRLKRIVTFDLHARQAQGHFDGPLDDLSAVPEFAAFYREQGIDAVISPDAGGAKRANYLAKLLGLDYHVLDKRRTGHGKAETRYVLDFDVNGKKIAVIDDMIDSGSSVVGEYEADKPGPIQYLQSRGAKVIPCATHAILSEKKGISAEERLRRAGVQVLFTDSLPEKYPGHYQDNSDWMTVISLDYAQAKAFYCNQVGESISNFLKNREEGLKAAKLNFVVNRNPSGLYVIEEPIVEKPVAEEPAGGKTAAEGDAADEQCIP